MDYVEDEQIAEDDPEWVKLNSAASSKRVEQTEKKEPAGI
jgi:hypothetical protein